MSLYLKALDIHVYFATTRDSYCLNGKNIEANAKAIHTLKSTLNDDYLSRVANIDSAFKYGALFSPLMNKCNIIRRVTQMKEVMLLIYTTWSKGMTPLR